MQGAIFTCFIRKSFKEFLIFGKSRHSHRYNPVLLQIKFKNGIFKTTYSTQPQTRSLDPNHSFRIKDQIFLIDYSRLPKIERLVLHSKRSNIIQNFDANLASTFISQISNSKSNLAQNNFISSAQDFDIFRKPNLDFAKYFSWQKQTQKIISKVMFISKNQNDSSLQFDLSDRSFSILPSLSNFLPLNATTNITLKNGLLLVCGGSHNKNHRAVNNCLLVKISKTTSEEYENFKIWYQDYLNTVKTSNKNPFLSSAAKSMKQIENLEKNEEKSEKTQPMLMITQNSLNTVKNLTAKSFNKLPVIENNYYEVCKFLLDPKTPINTFRALPQMLTSRFEHGVVETRNSIFVIGGRTRQDVKSKISLCEKFDKDSSKWSQIASLPTNLCAASYFEFRNFIYCVGGSSDSYLSNGFFYFCATIRIYIFNNFRILNQNILKYN